MFWATFNTAIVNEKSKILDGELDQNNLEQFKNEVKIFEDKINKALVFKYSKYFKGYPPNFLEHYLRDSPIARWNISLFIKIYNDAKRYPSSRLVESTFYLMDIKIQLYYLLEVILGLYNHMIYNRGYDNSDIVKYPHLHLIHLALDQTTIFMSTVLWERIYNFIYYLEKGERLDKNKTKKFWNFVKGDEKWKFMLDYKDAIEEYKNKLRTPEVHKISTLRKEFLSGRRIDSDYIMRLINIALNVFWDNLMNILKGEKASISFKDKFNLQPK